MPARWLPEGIPRELRVEMRVNVDEPRRDEQPARVDHLAGVPVVTPDGGDAIAARDDVGLERCAAAAVDDGAALEDEIGSHGQPGSVLAKGCRWPRSGALPGGRCGASLLASASLAP